MQYALKEELAVEVDVATRNGLNSTLRADSEQSSIRVF
jgi:hypothetical protein